MYKCSNCGYSSAKWMGRCPSCQEWESFYEEKALKAARKKTSDDAVIELTSLSDIAQVKYQRVLSDIGEFDRVLGDGLAKGSVVLIGGEPGIGKSTLLLEAGAGFSKTQKVLYISAEESLSQVSMRASRLGIDSKSLLFAAEDTVENILSLFQRDDIDLIIIDSIQVIAFESIAAAKGSVVQVREAAHALTQAAKKNAISLIIVGHVTKDGAISGPKLLEHIVDSVIYFEGDRNSHFRILRAVKNRFGSVGEIGVFEMGQSGLKEVNNPSSVFISEQVNNVSGRSVSCVLEGVRPMLIEIQALTSSSDFGNPIRRCSGFNNNKLSLIIAMIEKRLGMDLSRNDVYLNVTGGIRVDDPSADLAVVASVLSEHAGFVVPSDSAFIGEVGLLGELRNTVHIDARLGELRRLGFKRCFVPEINYDKINNSELCGLELVPLKNVTQLYEALNK